MSKNLAIGIDLGTTFSCVGVWKDNKVEVIVNEQGNSRVNQILHFIDANNISNSDIADWIKKME